MVVRVSVASGGAESNGSSRSPAVSPDARWIAFDSTADNLVPGDSNFERDVFLHDQLADTTIRVSIGSGGEQGNLSSGSGGHVPGCAVSANGQIVAFESRASTLVPGDTNLAMDVFVRELATEVTTRVSVATNGAQGNGSSSWLALTDDGRFVAFSSEASNLVPGDTNGASDVFLHDRQTGQTTRISVASERAEGDGASIEPSMSPDGRFVAYASNATNLVDGDTNDAFDVFVYDTQTGSTVRASVSAVGGQGDGNSRAPSVSADGSVVAFSSTATNLVAGDTNGFADIFLHSLVTGQTSRVSEGPEGAQGNASCEQPRVSDDGRTVLFASHATTLVSADSNRKEDAFARLVSSWTAGGAGLPGVSGVPLLSGTGILLAGDNASLDLAGAAPSAPCLLFVSVTSVPVPFKGGTLYAFPPLTQLPLLTDPVGTLGLSFVWPASVPPYVELLFQYAVQDAAALNGVALSNAVSGLTG